MTNTTSSTESKRFSIRGLAHWAHVKEPNTKGLYPSGRYELTLEINEKTAQALTGLGVHVRTTEDGKGHKVLLRSTVKPSVTGEDGEEFNDAIGNGSAVTVTASLYANRESNVKAGKGGRFLLGLGAVKIDRLVEFHVRPLVDE